MKRAGEDLSAPATCNDARQRLLQLRLRQRLEATSGAAIARRPASASACLSFAQEGLWFLDRMEGPSGVYNSALAVRLSGPLDIGTLERSVQALVERHESLRSAFEQLDGSAVQVVKPVEEAAAHLRLVPLRLDDEAAAQRAHSLTEWLRAGATEPFDLSRAPLLRSRLLRLSDSEHVLLLVVHHIVFDGWSKGVLTRELSALYAAAADATALAPLPIQFADYAWWQRERLSSAALQRQLKYWRRQLDGIETLDLPTDRPRPAQITYRGANEPFVLPAPLLTRLKALAQREGATLFMLLLAAFQVLLMRHARQQDVAVGVPVAGRHRTELEGLIGYFVNTLVMRADLSGNPAFTELLQRGKRAALDAYANQELPFDQLVAALSPQRDLGRHPLYQVSFALNNQPTGALELSGVHVETLDLPIATAKFDLSLALAEADDALRGVIEYRTDLFDATTITRFAAQYHHLLEAIVAEPTQRVARLALLSDAEQRQLLTQWNDTEVAYPEHLGVHQLVEAQVRRSPQAVAAIFEGRQTSYRELNAQANRLAHHLRGWGVGPEVPVGLCVERSLSTLVAVLGILKSGGAYVPMDPDHPAERLAFMLNDSAAPVVITQRSLRERMARTIPAGTRLLCVDDDGPAIASQPEHDLESLTRPEHLAYVIYTSGSTGQPKGVQIEHRGIGNQLHWLTGAVRFEPSDRVLFKTSVCFDASVIELLSPLVSGACVVVAPGGGERDIRDLPATIRNHAITVLQMVPSALRVLLAAPSFSACGSLRYLICGGEALDRELAREVRRQLPDVALSNFYGPTETSIDATWHEVRAIAPGLGTVPIGRPVSNVRCHVLDGQLHPVPIGVVGELCIGGAGLARGYLNRAALTAERFIADPFQPGERLYRSGDLARYLPDGTLECIGRIDDQVKLRGFRIELGEIEVALHACPGVKHSAVLLREDRPGLQQLIGYVAGDSVEPASLRDVLGQRLPPHMLPSAILRLAAWPLLPNGKLDRKALPPPDLATPRADHEPAGSLIEEGLVRIWSELLGLKTIGVHDDFFELGGHSLLAIRLLAEIEKALGPVLRVSTLFQAPTIRKLAAVIQQQGAGPGSCVVAVQPHGTRPRVFAVAGYGGGIAPFKTLARELGMDQPLCVLDIGVFGDEKDDFTLEELARRMVADMREVQATGPYHLVGYSLGGKIVYEMAQQLSRAGQELALLAMLDCAGPGYPKRASFVVRACLHLRHGLALGPAQAWRYLAERVWNLRKYVVRIRPKLFDGDAEASMPPGQAMQQSADAVDRARARYVPTFYPGTVLLVRAEVRPSYLGVIDDDPEMGWGPLVGGGVRLESLGSGHVQMLNPESARALASLLAKHLAPREAPVARARGTARGDA